MPDVGLHERGPRDPVAVEGRRLGEERARPGLRAAPPGGGASRRPAPAGRARGGRRDRRLLESWRTVCRAALATGKLASHAGAGLPRRSARSPPGRAACAPGPAAAARRRPRAGSRPPGAGAAGPRARAARAPGRGPAASRPARGPAPSPDPRSAPRQRSATTLVPSRTSSPPARCLGKRDAPSRKASRASAPRRPRAGTGARRRRARAASRGSAWRRERPRAPPRSGIAAVQEGHAVVHGLALHPARGAAPADAPGPLEHHGLGTARAQRAGERQPGDPRSDDDHLVDHGGIMLPPGGRGRAGRAAGPAGPRSGKLQPRAGMGRRRFGAWETAPQRVP